MGLEQGTISQEITTAGYVAIRLPANVQAKSWALWTEDGSKWEYATESDGSNAIDVTNDGTGGMPISVNSSRGETAAGAIICYAKGTATTNLVGIPIK